MIIFKSINKLNQSLKIHKNIGFVPTMGSIHKGHISLIKNSQKKSNKTLVSIFVNPTQFNKRSDYIKYPRSLKKDIKILKKNNVDYLIIPKFDDLYRGFKKKKVKLNSKDKILCARFRPGHFEGVLGVINRFISKIKFSKIYLGEKDYQQLFLIKKFIRRRFNIKVVACKTIRVKNTYAYSSRNKLLTKNNLKTLEKIAKIIIKFKKKIISKNKQFHLNLLKNNIAMQGVRIEYLEIRNKINLTKKFTTKNKKIFIAYYINKIRIIDNF